VVVDALAIFEFDDAHCSQDHILWETCSIRKDLRTCPGLWVVSIPLHGGGDDGSDGGNGVPGVPASRGLFREIMVDRTRSYWVKVMIC
jgi:hypothetical protein